jgi:signal transduction histidine kinase
MRLADFILSNKEPILTEWDAFAQSCAPASGSMDMIALRDHAEQMLTVIAADLAEPQSRAEQSAKSKGQGPDIEGDTPTAAEDHGAERAESGFTVEQMVAEYRALRATVIRLWTKSVGTLETEHIEDLTRFSEAVDQALAEAVSKYNHEVEQSKELFLGILGHDLRLPLGAIQTSATFMLETGDLQDPHKMLAQRVATSARRTVAMVGDLLDFTRGRLGGGIPIECVDEISLYSAHRDARGLPRLLGRSPHEPSLGKPGHERGPARQAGSGDLCRGERR